MIGDQEPENAGSQWKLYKALKTDYLLEPAQRTQSCLFQTSDLHSHKIKNLCCFKILNFCFFVKAATGH